MKTSQNSVAINIDDLKFVTFNKKTQELTVASSSHSVTLDDSGEDISSLERSINKRYHLVTISDKISQETTRDAYSTVLKIVSKDTDTYVWPRGLTTLSVSGPKVTIGIHSLDPKTVELSRAPELQNVIDTFKLLNIP